jgi:hypothetical protein
MTTANINPNLVARLSKLPTEQQQQMLDALEDADLLTNISLPELQALSTIAIAPSLQADLSELLDRNAEGELSSEEIQTLDTILEQVDQINILKARAKYTLQHLNQVRIA